MLNTRLMSYPAPYPAQYPASFPVRPIEEFDRPAVADQPMLPFGKESP
jgi:hypothetical protein